MVAAWVEGQQGVRSGVGGAARGRVEQGGTNGWGAGFGGPQKEGQEGGIMEPESERAGDRL